MSIRNQLLATLLVLIALPVSTHDILSASPSDPSEGAHMTIKVKELTVKVEHLKSSHNPQCGQERELIHQLLSVRRSENNLGDDDGNALVNLQNQSSRQLKDARELVQNGSAGVAPSGAARKLLEETATQTKSGRIPVPQKGHCSSLVVNSCQECEHYFDGRWDTPSEDNQCVWIPKQSKCGVNSWAKAQKWEWTLPGHCSGRKGAISSTGNIAAGEAIYMLYRNNTKCEHSNAVVSTAPTIEACQERAMKNGHTFYSFDGPSNSAASATVQGACHTSQVCSVRTSEEGWKVYKRWYGAFSPKQGDVVPATRCAVQTVRNSCSSCSADDVIVLRDVKGRRGECMDYDGGADGSLTCTPFLGSPDPDNRDAEKILCTKVAKGIAVFSTNDMEATDKAHFDSSVRGLQGMVVAECGVRKETQCIDAECDVQKQVRCLRVCKLVDWNKFWYSSCWPSAIGWNKNRKCNNGLNYDSCQESKCDGDFGTVACKSIAILE